MADPHHQEQVNESTPEIQPPEFLLPRPLQQRGTRSKIYLSWGDQIYGPSTRDEVLAGLRASWFEEGALYWHEGLDEWKPVTEFPLSAQEPAWTKKERPAAGGNLPDAPALPASAKRVPPGKRPSPGPAKTPARGLDGPGRVLVAGFILLAVLLTVGVILLLTLV